MSRLRARSDKSGSPDADALADSVIADAVAPYSPAAGDDAPRHRGVRIGELLEQRGLVTAEQIDQAVEAQRGTGKRLGRTLVELGLVHERDLATALAEQVGLEVVDLRHSDLDVELAKLLPESLARELHAVPVRKVGPRIEVAVGDPLAPDITNRLIQATETPVRLCVAGVTDIDLAINRVYRSTARVTDAIRVFEARSEARRASVEHTAAPTVGTTVDENAPVVQVVNLIVEQAVRDRASDVHIEPQEHQVRVRVRTDGALHEVLTLPADMAQSLLSRIKVMADMNIVERRRPQDGQFHIEIAGHDLDVRVSTTSTVFGEKAVLRLLEKSRALYTVDELGMPEETAELYRELVRAPYGMVICAGPTGSGKTTTLYATLAEIASDEINVTTIEDPVEYVFPSITQIQINDAAGVTFASGLRSILRQDPDAILVGEIRDVETARIATQAALTGHFVLSSLHATDSVSALHRFIDMGIEPFLVASALLGVVGQRLIRKICPHCLSPYTPTVEERAFYESAVPGGDKTEWFHGEGCNFCGNTGYLGRVGIYEVLRLTEELRELVVRGAALQDIRSVALMQGLETLQGQSLHLVEDDVTTISEVLRTSYVM
ncbi:MAG TPA: GspE/PulE family protein [Acidimicrobiia bacterium]